MLRRLDLGVLHLLRTHGHAPPLERVALAFTRCGEHGALWLVLCSIGALVDPRRRATYGRGLRVVSFAYLLNIGLKYVFRRRRPVLEGLQPLSLTVTALSYPSAHSTTSFAAARVLGERLPRGPLYVVAAAMALSRPYAGVHYPSDVVAGALLGTAVADVVGEARPRRLPWPGGL